MSSTDVHARLDADVSESAPRHANHRWWVLAVIGLAQLMVVLDATIVNIALPSAQGALHFNNDGRQWVVTAYSLAFGSLLLLGGRLADLIGRRTTFVIGIVGFAFASGLGGAATNFTMLVTARALQGVFGALLAPTALSLLTTTFTQSKDRARAFGVFGAIAGSGVAIGLILGGVLTEYLDWRWTLYANVVLAAFALVGVILFVPRSAPRCPAQAGFPRCAARLRRPLRHRLRLRPGGDPPLEQLDGLGVSGRRRRHLDGLHFLAGAVRSTLCCR